MKRLSGVCLAVFLCGTVATASPLPDSCDKQEILADSVSFRDGLKDPFEPFNRSVLYLNQLVDGLFLKPLSYVYKGVVPRPLRRGVGNVLSNVATPLSALNFAVQGEGKKAGVQLGRFLCNTVFGVLGIFDMASPMGLKKEETDFDKTLAKAGVPSGPYLMLPLLGPSTPRDALGRLAALVADPFNRLAIHEGHRSLIYTRTGIQMIHTRSQNIKLLETLEADPQHMYEDMRTIYSEMVKVKEGKTNPVYRGPKPTDSWN